MSVRDAAQIMHSCFFEVHVLRVAFSARPRFRIPSVVSASPAFPAASTMLVGADNTTSCGLSVPPVAGGFVVKLFCGATVKLEPTWRRSGVWCVVHGSLSIAHDAFPREEESSVVK